MEEKKKLWLRSGEFEGSIRVGKPTAVMERSRLIQEEELQEANKSNMMTYCVPNSEEVIKAVSGKGDPLKNFFYFDAQDGKGVIEEEEETE